MTRYKLLTVIALVPATLSAQPDEADHQEVIAAAEAETPEVYMLPAFEVQAPRVANEISAGTFAMPATVLRYEPQVDVQTRGIAEGQSDVTVRGGVFENTGFKLGAVTLFDAQTGHYFAEIPLDPAMLGAPAVLTGADNALAGFNSAVATIDYGFTRITDYRTATVAFGTDNLNAQHIGFGEVLDGSVFEGVQIGVEFSYARSEGDGTRPNGDHDFDRYTGRVQLAGANFQTDLYAGYQDKEYTWIGAYTGTRFGASPEFDNPLSELYGVNHRIAYGDDSFVELGAYHRRLRDHYVLFGQSPSFVFPIWHEFDVSAGGVQGFHALKGWGLNYGAQATADEVVSSTSLTNGFQSRTYSKLTLLPEIEFDLQGDLELEVKAGASWDDSNRNEAAVSPILALELEQQVAGGENTWFASYARATQVPGYTAIAGSETSGLFRSNASLDREVADNIEVGVRLEREGWAWQSTFFYRRDDDLADWTFAFEDTNARTANPVDLDTFGFETILMWKACEDVDLILGYTFLDKDSDYGDADIDASFYALNYANHRLTAAAIYRPTEQLELRLDQELRKQEDNVLRTSSDKAYVASLGATWTPECIDGLSIDLIVDNVTDSNFQEFPGTPSVLRQTAISATYRF